MYPCEWTELYSRKDSERQGINDTECRKFYEYAIDNDYQDKFMIKKMQHKIREEKRTLHK